jgi:outer membrane biosynthesis protein TonB
MRSHAATLNRASVGVWLVLCGLAGSVWATEDRKTSALPLHSSNAAQQANGSTPFAFDIPAQPLAEALKRYAALTRQPTLVRGELVTGLSSSAVRGVYSPNVALRLLLQGTGLEAENIPDNPAGGFILKKGTAAGMAPYAADLGDLAGYPGLVQAKVWKALCDDPRTSPGTYQSLLRFQVDAVGQFQRVRLLSSTGDSSRDAAVRTILQAVRMDRPPPLHLPQPLTLLIEPHEADGGPLCDRGAP